MTILKHEKKQYDIQLNAKLLAPPVKFKFFSNYFPSDA